MLDVKPTEVCLPLAGELAVGAATAIWRAHGFQVVRSFEIGSACAPFSHNICPHTGKSPCECTLAVLFVFGDAPSPVTVVVHGHEDETTFSVEEEGPQPDPVVTAAWDALGPLVRPRSRQELRFARPAGASLQTVDP